MFDLIKQVIESKAYKLEDMLYKINKMYIESYITEEEKTERKMMPYRFIQLDSSEAGTAAPAAGAAVHERRIRRLEAG